MKNFFTPTLLKVVIFVVLVGVVTGFFFYNKAVYKTVISDFDLTASVADAAGISPASHFILKTTAPMTTQVLERYVHIVPAVDFTVKKVSAAENTFEIIPSADLEVNRVYSVQVDKGPLATRDFSWAYQVKAPFQITSSIPGDKGVDVPVNTGIEFYFNRDNIVNPEEFIEIIPSVSGRFESSENGVRFIPNVPLEERTVYTLKINAGLGAKDTDDVLVVEKIIRFQTSQAYHGEARPSAYFSRQFTEFKPGSDMVFGVNAYNMPSVPATVYRFDSSKEFLDSVVQVKGDTPWARYSTDANTNLPENKKMFTAVLPIEKAEYMSTIPLFVDLSTGFYAIVIDTGSGKDISWFQVNPAASFVAFTGSTTLVWLRDITGDQNIAGVPIFFNDKLMGTTGGDGVALVNTPSELVRKPNDPYQQSERRFIVAKISTGDLVIPIENEYGNTALLAENDAWWDYVSLNKNIYLPTDTIRFWAIEKPRHDRNVEGELTVKLSNPYWGYGNEEIVTYAETKTALSEYGALTGELSFSNLKPGVYDLTFQKGDEIIAKQMVSVSAYIKPAYEIVVVPDRTTIFAGDSVTFKVKAQLFDGTPVSATTMSYSAYDGMGKNTNGTVVLDSQGEGSFTLISQYNDAQRYWPSYMSVSVKPSKSEEAQIETSSSIFVFGPHINNQISQKQFGSNVVFTVKTREVVLKDAVRGEPYWNTEDYLGSPVTGAQTNVQIVELIYIKNQTGTGYDPINKLTYPIYNYKTEERPVSLQTIVSDGNGLAELNFKPEGKKTYKLVFTARDSAGRSAVDTRYVYGGYSDIDFGTMDTNSYYLRNHDNTNYKIGQNIQLRLQTDQGSLPPNGKKNYLFMAVNNGAIEYQIQDTPIYNAIFQSEDVPNVGIWPGWFSNGRFHSSYLQNISFDANERRLNIEVKKDKQTYAPGEKVSLDIKVTDAKNSPVKAEVNLSALDEAVFSMRPDEKDIVNDLYRDIYSQVVIRTSNMPPYGGGGAEKGGGGDDAPRSNIQEMAIFKSVVTDSAGKAHVEFTLPENITSWRLTSQAVTKDLFVGKNVYFIPVTLPLFVDATLNKTYLAGDELTLRLRAFGTSVGNAGIQYAVQSPTIPFKKIERSGGNSVEFPLGALPSGNHELTVSATDGISKDALIRPLHVLDSYFTKNIAEFYEGSDALKIQNESLGYTNLVFSSYGKGQLYNDLKSLSYQWGIRLDQKGAQLVSARLLNAHFGEKNETADFPSSKYQAYGGGLQLLPYSSDDLEISAISAHLIDGLAFDRNALKKYLYSSLNDKKADVTRISRALYGLTAFGEPVLTKIQKIKDDPSLTLKDKVFIALALDGIGAKEEARTYFIQMIQPRIETKAGYAYVAGQKGDDTIIITALAAALTASLEESVSDQLAFYVRNNFPHETLSNLERLLYIKIALSKLDPGQVHFAYKTLSKEGSKTLKDGESFELVLSPEELKSLQLSDVSVDLGVVATYERSSTPGSVTKDTNLFVRRSYEVNGISAKKFNEGDTILVRIDPQFGSNALDGSYQIIDYVPSGLRPVDQESSGYRYGTYGVRTYPVEINDQKVTFMIDKYHNQPIYYYARVVSKGTYKAEPVVLQSLRSLESMTISDEAKITIE